MQQYTLRTVSCSQLVDDLLGLILLSLSCEDEEEEKEAMVAVHALQPAGRVVPAHVRER